MFVPQSTAFSKGMELSDKFSKQLDSETLILETHGESEVRILKYIFQKDDDEIIGIYQGFATSPDKRLRLLVLESLTALAYIDEQEASVLHGCLLADADDEVKKLAWELAK